MPAMLPVTARAPVAAGALAWRYRGSLRVSVVVKATFSLVPGGRATLRAPVDLVLRDVSFDRDAGRSLERASDLVPLRPRADVTFVGHAHAPSGRAVPAMSVRLSVFRGEPLVDRTLHVFGDRSAASPGAPAPFTRMPLVYERAHGGPSFEQNPIGRGVGPAASALPNIVDAIDPRRPAGFGPIAAHWAPRRGLVGPPPPGPGEPAFLDLPDEIAFEVFQAAPADQRPPYLHGDEWIVLDGLHPTLPRVETQLPAARGEARVTLEGRTVPVELHADTLTIDGDAQICSVVWRGRFALSSEASLAALRIEAGVSLAGQPATWEAAGAQPAEIAPPGRPAMPAVQQPAAHLASTFGLSDEAQAKVAHGTAVPFSRDATPTVTARAPAEGSPAETAPDPRPARRHWSTAALSLGDHQAAGHKTVTPFAGEDDAPLDIPTAGASPSAQPAPPQGVAPAPGVAPPPGATTPPGAPPPPPASPPGPEPGGPAACPPRKSAAIPVFNRTSLGVVTVPWQVSPPKESRTVIVKGTFDLLPGATARARDESELPTGDVHHGDDPEKSLAQASDFAVFKPRADVTLVGAAHGGATGVAQVSFAVGHPGNRFERRIAVFGERRWRVGIGITEPGPPKPFTSIPLTWEHAFGGAPSDDNPAGVGHAGSSARSDPPRLPNLEDPAHLVVSPRDTPPPACFGPLRADWKERRSRLGTYDASWLRGRWPWFPEDFDWSHFQAAPRPQQLAYLAGDEPYEIAGVRPDGAVLRGRLPGLRPRCLVEMSRDAGSAVREVTLRLDTAAFDAEALKLTLVWRGVLEVRDDEASEIAALMLGVEEMIAPPAPIAEVRAACLAPARLEPVAEPPAPPPVNDAAPEPDPELARIDAEIQARIAAGRAKLEAAGIPIPDPAAPAPPPTELPPFPDASASVEKLAAAGMPEKDVATLNEALKAAQAARDEALKGPAPRPDLRAAVIARLERGQPFEGLDLAGADLSGLDFGGRSLAGASLLGARLEGCNFAGADLSGAQLGKAHLGKATLEGANLTGADLTGAELGGAVFVDATIEKAIFAEARGEGAVFRGARGASAVFADGTWTRARFDAATLPAADFSRAVIDGASFVEATLPEVRLFDARGVGARFDGARMPEARADDVSLPESTFQGADAVRSTWEKAVLDGSSFRGARLRGASFVRAHAEKTVFSGADLREGRFSRARLADAQLLKANLMKAAFDRADLSRADLRASNLHGAETWKARLDGAQLELALVSRTKLKGRP